MFKTSIEYRPQTVAELHAEFIIGETKKTCGIYKPAALCMEIKT